MIRQLMNNPKAAQIYASLDLHIHPTTLADNYLQAKLSGNTDECLALEFYIRDLARTHFHRIEVLDALAAMERHKARRTMGKSAPKMLREIGARIRSDYSAGRYQVLPGIEGIKFRIDSLAVTCKDLPGAVELIACKYERGLPR